MNDQKRGLYQKYDVARADGSSKPGGKHENCDFFVLDLEHDKHARAAIKAYAKSCAKEFPELAKDLNRMLEPARQCGCRSASHELCGVFLFEPPRFGA